MKRAFIFSIFILTAATVFVSCKEDDPDPGKLQITFEMAKDGQTVNLNETFANDSVAAVRIENLKFYLSHIILEDKGELRDVEIVDFVQGRLAFTFDDIDAKTYSGLSFDVGLDNDQNASYPPDFETGTPLSASWAMYWSWAMKYRFVIIEGRGAPDGTFDASPDDFNLVIHPGMDGWNRAVNLSDDIVIKEGRTTSLTVQIDVDDMFNGPAGFMDLRLENTSHTTPADKDIAEKFMVNFAAAMSAK
ncbi:MAG: hypothetical protein EP346_03800 [Bacteroidetes bacterium]|nr:MAG: hypothetical protein EP346_03800 [Bacteroidota bacterium]